MTDLMHSRAEAEDMDDRDELCRFRDEFYIPNDSVYMDGNSLGLMTKRAEDHTLMMLDAWKNEGIDGWTEGTYPWYYLSEYLGDRMAPLIGANHNETIATGSTTVNLHHLAASFYRPWSNRTKILADTLNFPSDIYALTAQLRLQGYDPSHLVQVSSDDGHMLDEEDIIAAMTQDVQLIVLPSVLYRSGQILDMERLTKEAHARDISIGFDLCHSIGAIPHELHDWGVDFAFWCTYKHLNGGPGSVGGLFLHEKHFGIMPGLAGWFSSAKDKQFDMDHSLTPADDAGAFQTGTPHVLSAAPLIGALDVFHEAGIERVRRKSLALTDYMIKLIDDELASFGMTIRNPKSHDKRGGHVYVEHPEAARICKALKVKGVIPDFRTPSGIRLAPVALYNTFTDVYDTVHILKDIMANGLYQQFANERDVVS